MMQEQQVKELLDEYEQIYPFVPTERGRALIDALKLVLQLPPYESFIVAHKGDKK